MILDSLELMGIHCQQGKDHLVEEAVPTIPNLLSLIELLRLAVILNCYHFLVIGSSTQRIFNNMANSSSRRMVESTNFT